MQFSKCLIWGIVICSFVAGALFIASIKSVMADTWTDSLTFYPYVTVIKENVHTLTNTFTFPVKIIITYVSAENISRIKLYQLHGNGTLFVQIQNGIVDKQTDTYDSLAVGDFLSFTIYAKPSDTIVDNETASVTVKIEAEPSEEPSPPGRPDVTYYISSVNLGTIYTGEHKEFVVPFSWTGISQVIITNVAVEGTWIQCIQTTPLTFYREVSEVNGTGQVSFIIDVPNDISEGEYSHQISLTATTETTSANLGCSINFVVVSKPEPPQPISPFIVVMVSIVLACSGTALFAALFRRNRHNRSPV